MSSLSFFEKFLFKVYLWFCNRKSKSKIKTTDYLFVKTSKYNSLNVKTINRAEKVEQDTILLSDYICNT